MARGEIFMTGEYGHIQALTNPEMHFIVDLFERRK